jgi:flagellar biosynthetic protein FliQ
MDAGLAISLAKETLWTAMLLCIPPLGCALLAGLLISILQTVTSIQDATLAFAPKVLAVFLSVVIFGHWMLSVMSSFAIRLFTALPSITGG